MKKIFIHDKDLCEYVGDVSKYGLSVTDNKNDADVLMVGFRDLIDDSFLLDFPRTELIVCPATGVDHIKTNKIPIIKLDSKKSSFITASSEFTLLLILSLLRRSLEVFRGETVVGNDINSMTVGFVGYGRIGNNVSGYVKALGASVIWTDINPKTRDYSSGYRSLERVLSESDIIVIAVSAIPANENLISHEEFSIMKYGSYFVNISRGFVVNDRALLDSLESGRVSGAALDVVADYEIYSSYLKNRSNLIITNHVAGTTYRSRHLACCSVLKDCKTFFES